MPVPLGFRHRGHFPSAELVDNLVMVAVPGAMDAGPASLLFWGALAFSLAVAFVVAAPVNKWLITRGKGPCGRPLRPRRARCPGLTAVSQ